MKKILLIPGVLFLLVLLYLVGPQMPRPELNNLLPDLPSGIDEVEDYVQRKENVKAIKQMNEARILWANDSLRQKTDYVYLYLHGFSASWYEGYPVNHEFPKRYGCNAFLARLADHGLETETPLLNMTPDNLYESAKEALVIAHALGDKVIITGTSTGGTLALKLAADFPELVHALILYSPNIEIKDQSSKLLSRPWGEALARWSFGGDFRQTEDDLGDESCSYWYCRYRIEGVIYLQQLLDATMNASLFAQVKCPVFLGYYYRDEEHQDETVEVEAMHEMMAALGAADSVCRKIAFPQADSHVIACEMTSGAVSDVANATYRFAEEVLKMESVY